MSDLNIEKVKEALAKTLAAKGHWRWIADQPIHFGTKDQPPSYTPSGYWEYVPSVQEIFETQADVFTMKTEVQSKGFRIPLMLHRR